MSHSGTKPPYEPEQDEDELLDDIQYQAQKDAIVFAIEVSSSMLQTPKDNPESSSRRKRQTDSPTSAALKCAYELMQQRIISNPKDMIGVLLYGTEETRFPNDLVQAGLSATNSCLLVDLCVPSADEVRALRDLVDDAAEFDKLAKPSEEPVAVTNVLFSANQIFTRRAPNFASRRLFIVTDDDNPHENDKALQSSAAVRARDLYDLGVTIELFPVSKRGRTFDRSKFYNDIIYSHMPTDPDAPLPLQKDASAASADGDGIPLLQSLLSSIKSRAVPKRALFSSAPLEIGPGFRISVKGYIIFKKQTPAPKSYVWLKGEKAEIVTSHSSKTEGDSGAVVAKDRIRKAYKFGNAQVTFTPEETTELRNFGDPIIRIIGFKPQTMLPLWANIRNSTFIYPSEEGFVGSTRTFSALQQKLLRDKKMALAWFIARKNAAPVMAAILPGEEELNEEGDQVIPPGMWIVPLPYADDIRKDPDVMSVVAPYPVIDKMREVIGQLQLPKGGYHPEKYPNPSLQWHYRILQALALDEDIPEQPEDKTVPKYRQIQKRAGSNTQEWAAVLEEEHKKYRMKHGDEVPNNAVAGKKRSAAQNVKVGGERSKRVKSEAPDGITDFDMRRAFDGHKIEMFKVTELKEWLESKGLKCHGKKADLVTMVEQHFEKN